MNYWPRWVGDWKKKTAHLSVLERGAYAELLDHAYVTEKPLPKDPLALYRIVGAHSKDECSAVDHVVESFFMDTPLGYTNERVIEELAKRNNYVEGQRERANRRWSKPDAEGEVKTRANGHVFDLEALPDEWRVFCETERKDLSAEATFDKFRDHWKANANQRTGKKSDWLAAWRNWVRKEPPARTDTTPGNSKWWLSQEGIKEKGESLGLSTRPGESWEDFKKRIFDLLENK